MVMYILPHRKPWVKGVAVQILEQIVKVCIRRRVRCESGRLVGSVRVWICCIKALEARRADFAAILEALLAEFPEHAFASRYRNAIGNPIWNQC